MLKKRLINWMAMPRIVMIITLSLLVLLMISGCDQCGQRHQISDNNERNLSQQKGGDDHNNPTSPGSNYDGTSEGTLTPDDVGPPAPAVFFLAGLKGYTEPCGCTADVLLGGIDRIVGYVNNARELYPGVIMIDAGDMLFEHEQLDDHLHAQEIAKVDVLLSAHERMQTVFTVPGPRDFALGATFYLEKLDATQMGLLGANMSINGRQLESHKILENATHRLGFIGLVQESLYADIDGVETQSSSDTLAQSLAALENEILDARILVFHGELASAKQLLEEFPAIDFVIIGHNPRETDQVDEVADNFTLEAYDQGRYLGVLKLYSDGEREKPFQNARTGSSTELDLIVQQIEHVEESIHRIRTNLTDEQTPPAMLTRLEQRLADLHSRKEAMAQGDVTIPENAQAFIYRSIAMRPGYGVDSDIEALRRAYNRSLRELNADLDREVIPVADGEAFYIGTNECKTCHIDAYNFWETTDHSTAMATLEARDKDFDQNCVGCHVVGWEKPGGSVLGKLTYEAQVGHHEFIKDLNNVGCESCHGPGSEHRLAPLGGNGKAQNIILRPSEENCMECHVKEHSPGFDFENYVKRITGPGHVLSDDR